MEASDNDESARPLNARECYRFPQGGSYCLRNAASRLRRSCLLYLLLGMG